MIAGFAALEDLTGVAAACSASTLSATLEKTRDQVARIARHTAELIELGRDLRDDEITVLDGWAGELTACRSTRPWRRWRSARSSRR